MLYLYQGTYSLIQFNILTCAQIHPQGQNKGGMRQLTLLPGGPGRPRAPGKPAAPCKRSILLVVVFRRLEKQEQIDFYTTADFELYLAVLLKT